MGFLSTLGTAVGAATGFPVVGSIAGALGDEILGNNSARQANEANAEQAAQARDWQAQMRGTAYQATVKDLQAAGLNPMLAYSNGATQTPGAAMSAPMQNKGLQAAQQNSASAMIANTNADTALKAVQARKTEAEINQVTNSAENLAANTANTKQEFYNVQARLSEITNNAELARKRGLTETEILNLKDAERRLANAHTQLAGANYTTSEKQAALHEANAALANAQTALRKTELPAAKNEQAFAESEMGRAAPYGKAIGTIANSAAKVIKPGVTINRYEK